VSSEPSYINISVFKLISLFSTAMLQKILSTCPNIECIYLLVRNKKGKDVHSRVEEIFDDPMFDHMKEICPKFRYLVQAVSGDCSSPQLGISEMDQDMLIKKVKKWANCREYPLQMSESLQVNIVFHMAATVRFDEKLKIATQINVQATKDMLMLCSKMENLKSLIHVSTAYTHCPRQRVDEKFYPPPIDSTNMLVLTKYTNDELLETITPLWDISDEATL
jgi:alcohol-forming fatty acyl-CoA reductase